MARTTVHMLALSLALVGSLAAAQDAMTYDAFEALRRRAEAHPADTALQCNLGWAAYQVHDPSAAETLDRAIAALGTPTDPALVRRLAACLYSRGRVAESAATVAEAIPFYERSVALRASAAAETHLDGARRFVAARWVQTDAIATGLSPRAPAALAQALARPQALLVTRFVDAAGDEIAVIDDGDIVVASRRAGGTWTQETAWGLEDEGTGVGAWLEAPLEHELARVVVMQFHQHMPDWATLAVSDEGAVRFLRADPID